VEQPQRLVFPSLGVLYRALAPVTEPLIRPVAGRSLAIHGCPILFGDTAAAAKFFGSVGFGNPLFFPGVWLAWWNSSAAWVWRSAC